MFFVIFVIFRGQKNNPASPPLPPVLTPSNLAEVIEVVQSTERLLPVGGRTKPRLCETASGTTLVDLRALTGITEYQPSEYTITARAGTTLTEIADTLSTKDQYLPFDPPFATAGATLGGTLAANLSGPGRFRFGGVRDFILGLSFIDGRARHIHGGGKVVKNAAGFDTPKLMVGSLGRFGLITDLTFKVFPRPVSTLTLQQPFDSHQAALSRLAELARSRFELDALDYRPADHSLLIRLAGPAAANTALVAKIGGNIVSDSSIWPTLNHFDWGPPQHALVKIPTSPGRAATIITSIEALPESRLHLTAGANLLWVSLPETTQLSARCTKLGISGQVIRGPSPTIYLGVTPTSSITTALQRVFDPQQKFSPAH